MRNFFRKLFNIQDDEQHEPFGGIDERYDATPGADDRVTVDSLPYPDYQPEPGELYIDPLPEFRELSAGEAAREMGLRIMHFRPGASDGYTARCTTVVYRPRQDVNHTIEVALSVCSERDTFDKRLGTEQALMRFITGQRVSLPPRVYEQTDAQLIADYFA